MWGTRCMLLNNNILVPGLGGGFMDSQHSILYNLNRLCAFFIWGTKRNLKMKGIEGKRIETVTICNSLQKEGTTDRFWA